nr:MAG TPA: hypothetical protein [Caudoviricetes sp.]
MELSNYADMIYKEMTLMYSNCLIKIDNKELFKASLDGYAIRGYKDAIENAYNTLLIDKEEAIHLFEVLKDYLEIIYDKFGQYEEEI